MAVVSTLYLFKIPSADAPKSININFGYICIEIMSLSNFQYRNYVLSELETAEDMLTSSGSNIHHHQMVCKKQEQYRGLHFLWNYAPL